jgi:sigma-B regulation protein RsbU (phosphoserine phosphatase)
MMTVVQKNNEFTRQTEVPMRILVVDDNEDSRDIAEAALLSAGYRDVQTAGSAAAAFKHLKLGAVAKEEPCDIDIILLDIVMPEIDGIEACAMIRNDPRHADIPIIMVTSLDDMDSLANAFVAGATDYVTKPVNRIELLARVRAALKLKGELQRRKARERELLEFLSTWGDRRATLWMDSVTGLFVGEVAEAYLTAAADKRNGNGDAAEAISIVALAVDRLDACRSTQGEEACHSILARVAGAVRGTVAPIGAVAASYRDGVIVLVLPEFGAEPAWELGEALRAAVSRLAIVNPESIAADHVTATVAVVSGNIRRGANRAHLLAHAISTVHEAACGEGNQMIAVNVSPPEEQQKSA